MQDDNMDRNFKKMFGGISDKRIDSLFDNMKYLKRLDIEDIKEVISSLTENNSGFSVGNTDDLSKESLKDSYYFRTDLGLIVALGLNKECYETIDRIYSEKEDAYYEMYINSDLFQNDITSRFGYLEEDKMNKLISIISEADRTNNYLKVEKIIHKVQPQAVKYVKKCNLVNAEDFIYKFVPENKKSIMNVFSILVILMSLSMVYEKKCDLGKFEKFVFTQWYKFKSEEHDISKKEVNISNLEDITAKELKNLYIDNFDVSTNNLDVFFERLSLRRSFAEENISNSNRDEIEFLNSLEIDVAVNIMKNRRCSEYTHEEKDIQYFNSLIRGLGLETSSLLANVTISNNELKKIVELSSYLINEKKIEKDRWDFYIIPTLYIYALTNLYKDVKSITLNKNAEREYKKNKEYKNYIEKEKEIFKNEKYTLNRTLKDKNDRIQELELKLRQIEKINNKLVADNNRKRIEIDEITKENEELNYENKEIFKMLDEINKSTIYEESTNYENVIKELNKYKIGIFGGLESIKELGKILTDVTFFKKETEDISSIKKFDYIFINSDFFNHAFSKKVYSMKKKYNLNLGYIHQTNIKKIVEEMYNQTI